MPSLKVISDFSVIILLSFILFACSARNGPAPVVRLSTKIASPQNLTEISGNTYVVEKGDTLFAVAFYSGNDYRELARINKISSPYTISPGQTLYLTIPDTKKPTIQPKPAQTLSKIDIDPTIGQEYGDIKPVENRKKRNIQSKPSNNAHKVTNWIWPASGEYTLATVGSDGSKRGLDIKGEQGASVVAAASGKVVYAGNALKGYGNLVIIKHDDQYLSAYAHNDSILVGEQTYVKQGQQIATMGNSGASDTMLHFEIRKKGKSVNPFAYLPKQ